MNRTIGVLLPTKGRYEALKLSLKSLSNSGLSDLLEVIVVADDDKKSFEIASKVCSNSNFNKSLVIDSKERLFPVKAFNQAFSCCESEIFFWTNDEVTYRKDWLGNSINKFLEEFPDLIGVLSLYKKKKAGLGISSKKFVEANNGEWFHEGYRLYYPDDELTCRAILLGRYAFLPDSGVFHDIEITKSIPIIPPEEKIKQKKIDRGIFYQRTENNFGLDHNKIYEWKGFRDINFPLK